MRSSGREEETEVLRDVGRPPASAPSVVQSVPSNVLPSVAPGVSSGVPSITALQQQYQANVEQQMKHQVLIRLLKL